ncbi:MAG: LysR substrate-binding domain-containing protein [Pseudomonadota bacterium]
MKLQQLRYLLAIADNELNITAAAERLFTSQPGVSKQLKLLEDELGVQVFTRRGKSLDSVTPIGREIIERARRILSEVENIQHLAANQHSEQNGSLSIGTTHTQARYVLPPVIKRFRDCFPSVSLHLHQGTSEQIWQMIRGKEIDFAIVSSSGQPTPRSELIMLPCYRWDRTVIVPRQHPLAGSDERLTLPRLAEHPLITYVFSFSGESSLKLAFEQEGLTPEVVFTARDADVIKTYVRIGMGVGIVASMAAECDPQGDLMTLDAAGLFPRCTTWVALRRDAVLPRYMQVFLELFAPHLTRELTTQALETASQTAVDALLADTDLKLYGPCAPAEVG